MGWYVRVVGRVMMGRECQVSALAPSGYRSGEYVDVEAFGVRNAMWLLTRFFLKMRRER